VVEYGQNPSLVKGRLFSSLCLGLKTHSLTCGDRGKLPTDSVHSVSLKFPCELNICVDSLFGRYLGVMEPRTLLHVEDDDSAAFLFRLALDETELAVSVYRVCDGEQALQFLRKSAPYQNAHRPQLIVLDLNLPKLDGWSVLAEIQKDEHLRSIPVIVLSTAPVHINQARALAGGARLYLEKPDDFDLLVKQVRIHAARFLASDLESVVS